MQRRDKLIAPYAKLMNFKNILSEKSSITNTQFV